MRLSASVFDLTRSLINNVFLTKFRLDLWVLLSPTYVCVFGGFGRPPVLHVIYASVCNSFLTKFRLDHCVPLTSYRFRYRWSPTLTNVFEK